VNSGGHISFSSDPQAVIKSVSQGNGFAKTLRSRRRAHSQDRAKDRALPAALTNTPGPACMLCIIHASSRVVLDVIAISSSGPPSNTRPKCAAVACVPTEIASRLPSSCHAQRGRCKLRDDGCLRGAALCLCDCEAVSFTLRTGASSWRMLHGGRLSLCAPNGGQQAPAIFHTASMQLRNGTLICSVGSVACSARRSFVGLRSLSVPDLTLSAIAAVEVQQAASRASLRTLPPQKARDKLSQWLETLAPPRLVAGSRSGPGRVLIGGCTVASSPLRLADNHCRHPPSKVLQGCDTCPRCNPTMTLSDVQYAVRVWGAGRGCHRT
jgi:hypothetical protein